MTNPTAQIYPVGTRVRCVDAPHVGVGFPGLLGTVTEVRDHDVIYVKWDNPPSRDVNSTGPRHGGSWGMESLQILDNDETEALNARIAELELDLTTAQNDVLYLSRLNERKGAIIDRNHAEAARVKAEHEAHIEELDAWILALRSECREWVSRITRSEEIEEALHARLNEMARTAGDMAYERDAVASVLLYAFEHLAAADRQRVFGFWDAVMA